MEDQGASLDGLPFLLLAGQLFAGGESGAAHGQIDVYVWSAVHVYFSLTIYIGIGMCWVVCPCGVQWCVFTGYVHWIRNPVTCGRCSASASARSAARQAWSRPTKAMKSRASPSALR